MREMGGTGNQTCISSQDFADGNARPPLRRTGDFAKLPPLSRLRMKPVPFFLVDAGLFGPHAIDPDHPVRRVACNVLGGANQPFAAGRYAHRLCPP